MKDRYTYWGKTLFPSGEYRQPRLGEYFVDMEGDVRIEGESGNAHPDWEEGKRLILSEWETPAPIAPTKPVYVERTEPADACYCSVLGRMAPCSWCTDPERNEEESP